MDNLYLQNIPYVLAVNESKSFFHAAEKCDRTQKELNQIVHEFESSLGVTVFDRSVIPLRVTPEGEKVLEYIREMNEARVKLEQYCLSTHKTQTSDLTIAAPQFFCSYILPPIIEAYQQTHPDFSIKVLETNDRDIATFLKAGVAQFGVHANGDISPDLESFVLAVEPVILAVPADLPVNATLGDYVLSYDDLHKVRLSDASVPGVSLESFGMENFLMLREGNDMRTRAMNICTEAGIYPNITMELDQMLTAYYLSSAGEGITFIRASLPFYAGWTDSLRFYKIESSYNMRPIHILRCPDIKMNEKQNEFMDYLISYNFPWL